MQHKGAMADGYQKSLNLQVSGTSGMCLHEAENPDTNLSEIIGRINKNGVCVWSLYKPDVMAFDGLRIKSDSRAKPLKYVLEFRYKDSSVCYLWVHISIYNPRKSISLPTTFSRARPRLCWYLFLGFYDTVRRNK